MGFSVTCGSQVDQSIMQGIDSHVWGGGFGGLQGPDTKSLGRKGGGSREIMVPENNQGEEPRKQ